VSIRRVRLCVGQLGVCRSDAGVDLQRTVIAHAVTDIPGFRVHKTRLDDEDMDISLFEGDSLTSLYSDVKPYLYRGEMVMMGDCRELG
jgi:hypothetical protein